MRGDYVVRGGLSIGGFVGCLLLLGVFYRRLEARGLHHALHEA